MEENNKIIPIQQNPLIPKVASSLRITNKLLSINDGELIPYRKGNKWGYCTPDKKIVIDCVYDEALLFTNGLAGVKRNEKWGFIDFKGNIKINLEYDDVEPFNEGLAAVFKNDEDWSFIDLNGKLIYSNFSYLNNFSDGLAAIKKDDKYGFIDKSGVIIIPIIYDCNWSSMIRSWDYESDFYKFSEGFVCLRKNNKYGFFDRTGKMIVPFIYDEAQNFSNGLAKVGIRYPNNNNFAKAGYIDYLGNLVIPLKYFFRYSEIPNFSEGLELVFRGDEGISERFYINKNDEIIIPDTYELNKLLYMSNFSEGMALVMIDFKYGFMNNKGKVVIPCIYHYTSEFSEGVAYVSNNDDHKFINTLGERVIENTYSRMIPEKFKNGLCLIHYSNFAHMTYSRPQLEGYINKKGTEYWED